MTNTSADQKSDSAIRELARAKVRAQAAYEAFTKQPRKDLTEDEQVDREIESKRLCRILNDADYALYKAVSA